MPLVQGGDLFGQHAVAPLKQAAVQVERAFDAVLIEDFDQAAVLGAAVVVAHGQRLMLSAGEAAVYSVHISSA